jgi:hypothetical protein
MTQEEAERNHREAHRILVEGQKVVTSKFPILEFYNYYISQTCDVLVNLYQKVKLNEEEQFNYNVTYHDFLASDMTHINILADVKTLFLRDAVYYIRPLDFISNEEYQEKSTKYAVKYVLELFKQLLFKASESELKFEEYFYYWAALASRIFEILQECYISYSNSFRIKVPLNFLFGKSMSTFLETINFICDFKEYLLFEGVAYYFNRFLMLFEEEYIHLNIGVMGDTIKRMIKLLEEYNEYARECEGAKVFDCDLSNVRILQSLLE